jgi:hypothetical protein
MNKIFNVAGDDVVEMPVRSALHLQGILKVCPIPIIDEMQDIAFTF